MGGMTVVAIIGASAVYLHTNPDIMSVQVMVHSCIDPRINASATEATDRAIALGLFDRVRNYFHARLEYIPPPIEHPVSVPEEVLHPDLFSARS